MNDRLRAGLQAGRIDRRAIPGPMRPMRTVGSMRPMSAMRPMGSVCPVRAMCPVHPAKHRHYSSPLSNSRRKQRVRYIPAKFLIRRRMVLPIGGKRKIRLPAQQFCGHVAGGLSLTQMVQGTDFGTQG
jgi:hypothetical protein